MGIRKQRAFYLKKKKKEKKEKEEFTGQRQIHELFNWVYKDKRLLCKIPGRQKS